METTWNDEIAQSESDNSLPRRRRKRHVERHRVFTGAKTMTDLERILDMRMSPTFKTNITISDISNIELIKSEWARFESERISVAAALASLGIASEHGIGIPEQFSDVVQPSCPAPSLVPPSKVDIEDEVFEGRNTFYLHPDLAEKEAEDVSDLSDDTADCLRGADLQVLEQVGNILSLNGYLDCTSAASYSAAIGMELLPPRCKKVSRYAVTIRHDRRRIPDSTLRRQEFRRKIPAWSCGIQLACKSITKREPYKLSGSCPCSAVGYTNLCTLMEDVVFCDYLFGYRKALEYGFGRRR